jgi:hypothetical protein
VFWVLARRFWGLSTDMDIADRAIQLGGAREGQSFVLKV